MKTVVVLLILGCTDSAAFNYDQSANTDDGNGYLLLKDVQTL